MNETMQGTVAQESAIDEAKKLNELFLKEGENKLGNRKQDDTSKALDTMKRGIESMIIKGYSVTTIYEKIKIFIPNLGLKKSRLQTFVTALNKEIKAKKRDETKKAREEATRIAKAKEEAESQNKNNVQNLSQNQNRN